MLARITKSLEKSSVAMYWCNLCGKRKDGDWSVCSPDPRPGEGLELVCEDCACELEEEDDGE